MKSCILMIALAFIFSSCVKEDKAAQPGEPGDSRTFHPQTPETREADAVSDICAALEVKNREILDYVDRETLSVKYQESECGGKLGKTVGYSVKVRNIFGQLQFQNAATNFGLPEVELTSSGTMKEICQNLPRLTNPMPAYPGSRTIIEFRSSETSKCHNDSQHACVVIFKGRLNDDGVNYTVDESTLIRFRTVRDRTGFYTFKSVKSYGSCTGKEFRTKIATFEI